MSSGTDLDPQGTPVFVTNQVGAAGTPSHVTVDSGTVAVSNFPVTQPVSAASLPLPTGASTETTLALIKAKTDNLDVALSTRTKPGDTQTVGGTVTANAGTNLNTSLLALEAGGNLAAAKTDLDSIVANQTSGGQKTQVTNFPATQPVSATALPLPSGAALETGNLATLVSAAAEAGVTSGPTETQAPPNAVLVGGREDSGDFHALNVDGGGNVGVNIMSAAPAPLSPNAAQETGGNLAALLSAIVNGSPVSITSLPLPPGASTEGGNLALLTQALGDLLAESRRHTVLLCRILGATGNDVPDRDTIDQEVQGSGQSWQLQ